MQDKVIRPMLRIGALLAATSVGVFAQPAPQPHLSGLISDHTSAASGSWEVHGEWSLRSRGDSGRADFSAVLTMERSDYWVLITPGADADARSAHTHHIALEDGEVTPVAHGFEVSGMAAITGNGNPARFGLYSPVLIDITGGSSVAFSNIKITFEGAAAGHFGALPLAGVVRSGADDDGR